ncbi:MAG: hypothetical protein ABL994_13600, partial [Verrucomicrobiales bacterium]
DMESTHLARWMDKQETLPRPDAHAVRNRLSIGECQRFPRHEKRFATALPDFTHRESRKR